MLETCADCGVIKTEENSNIKEALCNECWEFHESGKIPELVEKEPSVLDDKQLPPHRVKRAELKAALIPFCGSVEAERHVDEFERKIRADQACLILGNAFPNNEELAFRVANIILKGVL